MYLDLHILHTIPYANLNRDDTGRPKEATYGGTPRIRVSAQSWKRAIRLATDERLVRSRRIPTLMAAELVDRGWDAETAHALADELLFSLTRSSKKEDGKPVLLFLTRDQIAALVDLAAGLGTGKLSAKQKKDAEKARDAILQRPDGSLHLFGRMFANAEQLNIDAALQIAHALSTHTGRVESDWFTAVDDLAEYAGEQGAGAGHLDSSEYTSATFYRYLTINVTDLAAKLGPDDTLALLGAALPAIVTAMPTGKQNTTAAHTRPDLVAAALRRAPMSYVGAFEQPVARAAAGGYLAPSIQQLAQHADQETTLTGEAPVWAAWAGRGADSPALGGRVDSYPALVSEALAAVAGTLPGDGGRR